MYRYLDFKIHTQYLIWIFVKFINYRETAVFFNGKFMLPCKWKKLVPNKFSTICIKWIEVFVNLICNQYVCYLHMLVEYVNCMYMYNNIICVYQPVDPVELMEPPLRVQVMIAQTQAGMWRRNGYALLNQVWTPLNSTKFLIPNFLSSLEFQIYGYLLLPSRDMTENFLKGRKYLKQPNQTNLFPNCMYITSL